MQQRLEQVRALIAIPFNVDLLFARHMQLAGPRGELEHKLWPPKWKMRAGHSPDQAIRLNTFAEPTDQDANRGGRENLYAKPMNCGMTCRAEWETRTVSAYAIAKRPRVIRSFNLPCAFAGPLEAVRARRIMINRSRLMWSIATGACSHFMALWHIGSRCLALTVAWVALVATPALAQSAGTSAWISKTSPPKPTGWASKVKVKKTKPKLVRKPSRAKPLSTNGFAKGSVRRSTLGKVLVAPEGPNAAYIAFDQGQYLTALKIARHGAERGDAPSYTLMGRIIGEGLGVPVDHFNAAKLYRRGAELGDIEATFAFAVMLAAGRGIRQDSVGAAKLFEKAAKKGHPQAHYNLGLLFLNGTGKPENPRRAFLHIRYAAEQGLAAAQYDLAALHRRGIGTNPDAYAAARWLRKAAESGMSAAQFEYAVSLLRGEGVVSEQPKAVFYLTEAARKGVAGAQNRLAHAYAEGKLLRRNMIEAAKWRLIARASGLKPSKPDKVLDKKLSGLARKQINRAQYRADAFIEGHRTGARPSYP